MAEQWVSAAAARQLVAPSPNDYLLTLTLCTRCHAGLVRTRARLLIVGGERIENCAIPPKFWWAGGREALEQDWQTGDFATWENRSIYWQAFGVSFALTDLLEILPSEQRALARKQHSVSGNPDWVTARDALRYVRDKCGYQPKSAEDALIDLCRLGLVSGRAVLMRCDDKDRPADWDREEREWDIPIWFWERFTLPVPNFSTLNWQLGRFAGKGWIAGIHRRILITLTGVYFLAETLNLLLPAQIDAPKSEPAANPGGRPPKTWWDDLWCEVWGQVYRGDLKPSRQADIERAMLDWASTQRHAVSESTIKPLARKMLAEMMREGKNP
jgi:hypothetical protein